jgi:hypothetical protein
MVPAVPPPNQGIAETLEDAIAELAVQVCEQVKRNDEQLRPRGLGSDREVISVSRKR